jgi:hypothetical protein
MSVENRRFAAAQRTAAVPAGPRGRLKLTATWLVIATALSAFSFTVVAGASTFGKPDYGRAVEELAKKRGGPAVPRRDETRGGGSENDRRGGGDQGSGEQGGGEQGGGDLASLVGRLVTSSDGRLCVVSRSALTRIDARYEVGRLTISFQRWNLDIVAVKDASESDLRALLGPGGVSCTLVHLARTFYLPFDANLS